MPWVALCAIVVAAIVLRFADLASNPGGLFPDEAAEGLDARRILHDPLFRPVFLASDGGREALFAYLVAGVFAFAGETVFALRATAAAIGVLGVAAIWLLGSRFGRTAGLAAAAWAAGSLWLVCVDRDGMRNCLVPLFGALAMVALIRWSENPGRLSGAFAGAIVALAALYTYQPLKLLPVLVLAWIGWLWRSDRERARRLREGFVPFALVFVIVALPMAAAAITDPGAYFGRVAFVSPLNPDVVADSSIVVHLVRTLGMLVATGDPNGRHDVSGQPLLGWTPLAWLVLIVCLFGLLRAFRHRRDPRHALILVGLPLFLLPPLIAVEGYSPHFLRSLGLAAPLGVLIGLGTNELVERARARPRSGAAAALLVHGAVAATLGALAVSAGVLYVSRPVSQRAGWYAFDVVALSRAADAPRNAVVVDEYDSQVVRFLDPSSAPAMVAPGPRIPGVTAYDRIVARSREELIAVIAGLVDPAPGSGSPEGAGGADGVAVGGTPFRIEEVPSGVPGEPSVWVAVR